MEGIPLNFNSATMRLNNADTVPYLTYNSLSEIKFINHAFSTRLGGVSEGEFTSMNMAFNRGDNPDAVTENYRRICESAGFEFDSLTASAQDHHTVVRAVTRENRGVGIYKPRDMESVDGQKMYQRSLCFLLVKALHDVDKTLKPRRSSWKRILIWKPGQKRMLFLKEF